MYITQCIFYDKSVLLCVCVFIRCFDEVFFTSYYDSMDCKQVYCGKCSVKLIFQLEICLFFKNTNTSLVSWKLR